MELSKLLESAPMNPHPSMFSRSISVEVISKMRLSLISGNLLTKFICCHVVQEFKGDALFEVGDGLFDDLSISLARGGLIG